MLNLYAVKDVKSQLFNNPFVQKTDGTAIRTFATACEDKNTDLNKYPSDFSLYRIGTYDEESGKLSQDQIMQVANASEFVPDEVVIADKIKQIRKEHLED